MLVDDLRSKGYEIHTIGLRGGRLVEFEQPAGAMTMEVKAKNPGQRLRAIENAGGPVASHGSRELMPDAKGQEDRPWSGGVNPQLLDEADFVGSLVVLRKAM